MADPHPQGDSTATPTEPEAGALIEAYSRGKGELVSYLRGNEVSEYLIDLVAKETGVRRIFVRAVYNLLVTLVVDRAESQTKKLAGRLAEASIRLLQRLPFYGPIAQSLLKLEQRLRQEEDLKARFDALMAGRLRAGDFGDAAALSREAQVGLHVLEEQEALWADVDKGFDEILGRLNPRPPLSTRILGSEAVDLPANRLKFNARRVPFVGRALELASLAAFLDADRRFCWWLVTGPGGLGKSRLALELCLQRSADWRAGFLRRESAFDNWEAWQPEAKTLIVVDYVGGQVERARRIITTLRDREADIDAPVRLLLLERRAEGQEWWRQFITPDATGAEIKESCFDPGATPLTLGPLIDDDLWTTVRVILDRAGADIPDREATLKGLLEIDPERRPLFAALAGDALAAGRSTRGWDRARLLEDVLGRERQQMWPANIAPAEVNLLALATMCGGLPVAEAERAAHSSHLPAGFLPEFDPDAAGGGFSPSRYVTMVGRALENDASGASVLPPLEPDIVGEFFVLRHLLGEDGKVLRQRVERFCRVVRSMPRPYNRAFGEFVTRCVDDFFAEPAARALAQPPGEADPPDFWYGWLVAGASLIDALGGAGQVEEAWAIYGRTNSFARSRPEESKAQRLSGVIASKLLPLLTGSAQIDRAREAYERLAAVSAAYPDDLDLLSVTTNGTAVYCAALARNRRLDQAMEAFGKLAGVARDRPEEASHLLCAAFAATSLVPELINNDRFDDVRTVIDRLEPLVLANPGDPGGTDFRVSVSSMASDLLDAYLRKQRTQDAKDVLRRLANFAAQWPIPSAYTDLAAGMMKIANADVDGGRLDEARATLTWIADLSKSNPENEDLRLAASDAGLRLTITLATAGRTDEALALWSSLAASAAKYPQELYPRWYLFEKLEELSAALRAAGGADRIQEFTDRLSEVAAADPTIGEVRAKTSAAYFDRYIATIANDMGAILRAHGAGATSLPRQLRPQFDDKWLSLASNCVGWLIRLANLSDHELAGKAEWRIVGTAEQEGQLRLCAARAAATLVATLLSYDRKDDALLAARSTEKFLRSDEFKAFSDSQPDKKAHRELQAVLDELATARQPAP